MRVMAALEAIAPLDNIGSDLLPDLDGMSIHGKLNYLAAQRILNNTCGYMWDK